MDHLEFEYQIAISYLEKDEKVATELFDLLSPSFKVFIYTKYQEKLVGTDGEEIFNLIFGKQSRIVVILYRKEWGKSGFTRIEETAIKNRAYNAGYDFTVWVPLDTPPEVPSYVPKTRMWYGLERFGMNGLAGAVESRIQESGGSPHEETVQERAVRLERAKQFAVSREFFLNSDKGVKASNVEFANIIEKLKSEVAEINRLNGTNLILKQHQTNCVLVGGDLGLSINWKYHYSNNLNNSELVVAVWDSHPPFPGIIRFENPHSISKKSFDFELTPSENLIWRSRSQPQRDLYSTQLADFALKLLFEAEENNISRKKAI